MSSQRTPALAAIGLGVALLAVLGIWWLQQDGGEVTVELGGPSDPAPQTLPVPDAGVAQRTSEERQPLATEGGAVDAVPESYRALLGGFRGRIVEADLTPAAELPVSVLEIVPTQWAIESSALLGDAEFLPNPEVAKAVTDEDGYFELTGLEPRGLHLLGIDLGGPRATPRIVDHSPRPGEVIDLGEIVLEPYVTFIGRVVDDSRDGVAGARVRATNLPGVGLAGSFGIQDIRRGISVLIDLGEDLVPAGPFEGQSQVLADVPSVVWDFERLLPLPTTTTDDDGYYRLEGVPQGMITVFADKAKHFGAVLPSQPSGNRPERKLSDLVLTEGSSVRIQVTDADDQPVSGLAVRAGIVPAAVKGLIPIGACIMHPGTNSDFEGQAEVRGLPNGPDAYVALRRGSGEPWVVHGPFPDHDGVIPIRVKARRSLRVRCLADDGTPVEPVELFTCPGGIMGVPALFAPPMERLRRTTPEGDGWVRVDGLATGTYTLVGRAEGYALAESEFTVGDDSGNAELLFSAGHSLDVTILDSVTEEPLRWSFVTIAEPGLGESPIDRERTSKDGVVTLEGMQAGEYQISVQHPSRASLSLDVTIPSEPLTLRLTPGGHLAGRVHDAGTPPETNLYVIVFPDGEESLTKTPQFSVTNSEGRFLIPNLEAGEYSYQIRDRIVGSGPLALFTTLRDDPFAEGDAVVIEGETTELDIDISGLGEGPIATLRGEVWLNGRPAEGLTIFWEGDLKRSAETDDSGYFDLGTLPAGEGRLTVQRVTRDFMSLGSHLHREDRVLADGGADYLNLDLRLGTLSGRVSTEGFLPTPGMSMVSLRRDDGSAQFTASANMLTGAYRFDGVPEGEYKFSVQRRGYATVSDTVDVRGSMVRDVALAEAAALSGTVVLPAGASLEPTGEGEGQGRRRGGAMMSLIDDSGDTRGRTFVRRTGAFRVDGVAPGRVKARLRMEGRVFETGEFTIAPEGGEDVVLTFTEVVENRAPSGVIEGATDG